MDDAVKSVISARKDVFKSYNIIDENLNEKIESLFIKINELGNTCSDVTEFENKFTTSSLNTEYTNLIVEVAQTSASELNPYNPSLNDYIKQDLKEEGRKTIMNTPIGGIIQGKNTFDLLKKHIKKDES